MREQSNNIFIEQKTYTHTPSEIAKSVYYYVQHVGYYKCGMNHETIRSGMKSVLVLLTKSGKGYLHYRKKKYKLGSGDVFIVNCKDYHKYGTHGNDSWEFKFLHFYGNNSREIFEMIYKLYGAVLHMQYDKTLENIIDELDNILENPSRFMESRAMAQISKLLSEIIQSSASNLGKVNNNRSNAITDKAIEFIKENYDKNIQLEDIANSTYTSKYHFSRIFKRIIGSTPYSYLINYRINISKQKLEQTDKSIADIAIDVGFESPSNFIKTFHKTEGITPNAYRRIWKS